MSTLLVPTNKTQKLKYWIIQYRRPNQSWSTASPALVYSAIKENPKLLDDFNKSLGRSTTPTFSKRMFALQALKTIKDLKSQGVKLKDEIADDYQYRVIRVQVLVTKVA